MATLKRQFITDAAGTTIGILLPIDEFALVAETLEQRIAGQRTEALLRQMEAAAHDPLFLADLTEAMADLAPGDADWWEHGA